MAGGSKSRVAVLLRLRKVARSLEADEFLNLPLVL